MVTFSFTLASGYLIGMFKNRMKIIIAVLTVLTAVILSVSFFREDKWLKINDNDLFTGDEWTNQKTASIGDYWPDFGHQIPNKPSDGKYINYFPGWVGAIPDNNGLIPSEGVVFTDTPIRKVGNMVSLIALILVIATILKNKRKKV